MKKYIPPSILGQKDADTLLRNAKDILLLCLETIVRHSEKFSALVKIS